jgi:hypothetical protein
MIGRTALAGEASEVVFILNAIETFPLWIRLIMELVFLYIAVFLALIARKEMDVDYKITACVFFGGSLLSCVGAGALLCSVLSSVIS